MTIEFEVTDVIPATPATIYAAWLSSDGHSAMTGSPARASAEVGGAFDAQDGFTQGENLELKQDCRIVQSWRTRDFAQDEEDSRLEVLLEAEGDGTRITIRHSRLPEDGEQYRQGWVDAYLTPMRAHFGGA
jgi:uncharacterized protein YndB with AHSA1/START domain